ESNLYSREHTKLFYEFYNKLENRHPELVGKFINNMSLNQFMSIMKNLLDIAEYKETADKIFGQYKFSNLQNISQDLKYLIDHFGYTDKFIDNLSIEKIVSLEISNANGTIFNQKLLDKIITDKVNIEISK